MTPFDYINAINANKDIIGSSDNPEEVEKGYTPFMVNRGLSYFVDTILYANEMNSASDISNKLQFDYLRNSIKPKKRFSKWAKRLSHENINVIKEIYKYSDRRAMEVLSLLSDSQIALLKEKLKKGGVKNE
jgi:hypothetical protein